ncbi:hypothetical protein WJX81_001446 [Elliptochloris bilobata]|uniref:SigF-like NTF2-like domain-containing protein n=1 Tax=Elliptochloris bilobata TaxID=381761 RepID=A0AAW1RHV9_9CHLO
MQNVERDLKEAFRGTLSGIYEERRQTVERVFAPDAKFWHLAHVAYGRDNIWGIYQLWAANNYKTIEIKFTRMVHDKESDLVLIDLLEYCSVWWMPINLIFGGPVVSLHVILQLKDSPHGKVICYQEDHAMLLESALLLNMPTPVVRFLEDTVLPAVGTAYSTLGNALYKALSQPRNGKLPCAPATRLVDVTQDLPDVVAGLFNGTPCERRAACAALYAEDAVLWNSLYTVRGRDKIFGAINFWVLFNREFTVKINRIVPSGNTVLVDVSQEYKPFWWPPLLPPRIMWNHIILTLADGPNGSKVIVRHENHPLALEATLIANLGPISWLINVMRGLNGILFGFAGRLIYYFCDIIHRQLPLLLNIDAYKPTEFTRIANRPFALEPHKVPHARLHASMKMHT